MQEMRDAQRAASVLRLFYSGLLLPEMRESRAGAAIEAGPYRQGGYAAAELDSTNSGREFVSLHVLPDSVL